MDTRYLQYGVFVPKSGVERRKPEFTSSASFTWGRVNGKWAKIGADGKPLPESPKPPPPPSSTAGTGTASTLPSSDRGVDRNATNIYGSSALDNSRSRTTIVTGDRILPGVGVRRGAGTAARASSVNVADENDEDVDDDDNEVGEERMANTATAAAGGLKSSNTWETSPPTSSEDEVGSSQHDHDTDDGAVANNSSSQELMKPDGDDEDDHSGDERREGTGSAELSSSGSTRRPSTEQVMTPGFSRSGNHVGGNFFGDENDASPAATPTAAAARQESGEAAACIRNTTTAAAEIFDGAESGEAACVGERARGGGGERGKFKRTGSGSSNTANSPRKSDVKKPPVETKDIACQWDGAEMGDGWDESDDVLPQVELPDTPDCNALMAVLRLYDHARLENKRMGVVSSRPGWGVDENIENWDGVYLDMNDRVVALDVDGDPENRQAVLIGPLPVELSGMDHLEQLTMRRHRFKGRIPAELGKLTKLTHLNLSNCRLIGFLPPEFGELVNLVVLNLSWNFLSGELPSDLGRLTKLEELLLNSNAFSGALPPEIGKLRKLQRFNAGHNIGISGNLPPEMCRMTQLALLDLRHNKIAGQIPPLFGRLTNLQQLWLQDNQLTGDIPAELARLPRLQMLHLGNNQLSGVIPKALRGHPRYLSFKILSGNIALGEKVAPNEREIEAASRRTSATSAIAHVTAVHAQAQKTRQQKGHTSDRRAMSLTSSRPNSPGLEHDHPGSRRSTVTTDASSVGSSRGGMGRRSLRGMKRIMFKKTTPPDSPAPIIPNGYRGGQPPEEAPFSPVGRIIVPGSRNSTPPRADGSSSAGTPTSRPSSSRVTVMGKGLRGATGLTGSSGGGVAGADGGGGSPNATDSLSTSHASPSSNDE